MTARDGVPGVPPTFRGEEAVLTLAVVAAWAAASWHWLSGRRFIPWDSVDAFFPQVAFIVAALRAGEWPVWNPLAFGGQPVLGDPQGLLFTPHVLTGVLSSRLFGLHVFDITTLGCVLLGGLCLRAYARRHGAAPALAALAAIVFMLAGVATSRLQHTPQIVSYGLLPALLLAFRLVMERPGTGSVLGLGATGLLLALNPNQLVFLVPFLLAPVLLVELAQAPRRGRALLGVGVAVAGAALLAAPSAAALVETVALSSRRALTLADSIPASKPGHVALSLVLPGLYGVLPPSRLRWSPVDSSESHLYLGVVPLLVIGAGMTRRLAPPPLLVAAWIGAALSFAFTMGVHGPLFPLLFEHVPGFTLFRRPADGAYFLNLHAALAVALALAPGGARQRGWAERLALPALAAGLLAAAIPGLLAHAGRSAAMGSLRDSAEALALRLAIALGFGAAAWALLRDWPRRVVLAGGALALTTLDLSTTGRAHYFSAPYRSHEEARMFRRVDKGLRLDLRVAANLRALEAEGGRGWRTEVLGGDLGRLGPMVFGFPLAQGYNPLRLQRFVEVFGGQNLADEPKRFSPSAPSHDAPAYRWLGLRFLLLHGHILDHAAQAGELGARMLAVAEGAAAAGARRLPDAGTYRILELPNAYPRAGLIPREGGEDGPPTERCDILSEGTTSLAYRCRAQAPARLVIGDSFAPGWMACVGGRRAPVEPFLGALRAVPVPQGDNLVRLTYQPVPFLRGLFRCAPA